jgi:hypothetical protein
MTEFQSEIALEPCWDESAEIEFRGTGMPRSDRILQNPDELNLLCEWIATHHIRSYLEIGIWTGRLVSLLDRIFHFDVVAACDAGHAQDLGLPLHLPRHVRFLRAKSNSWKFKSWRRKLGHIDLVLIDADHSYAGVRRDFKINRRFPHRYLAFHDVANTHPNVAGVKRFWQELDGNKEELISTRRCSQWDMGIGIWSRRC